jgi:hypothetical protein
MMNHDDYVRAQAYSPRLLLSRTRFCLSRDATVQCRIPNTLPPQLKEC